MFSPTPEQASIVEAARSTEDNLLISALAGAAKTSTLVLIAEALPETELLCLAFNKKIAVEMQERLPNNCKAQTLNSLGHRVWGEAIGRRLKIDAGKGYEVLKSLIDELPSAEKSKAYNIFGELLKTIAFGKACGYIPTDHYDRAKRLMNDDEFFARLDEDPSGLECDLIRGATLRSLEMAFAGTCDYDDQILMPTIFQGAFPRYPLVLIDEAQDLSALNHATLRKLAKKRLIAVGDPYQAIYGFRGAHEESMTLLRETFSMKEMMLTVSFRCPTKVVEHVRWRAPSMQYPDWAVEGSVTNHTSWTAETIPDDAVILCRNNAPLFACAIKLLARGRRVEIMGNDIGKGLLKLMKNFGEAGMERDDVLLEIEMWVEEKLAKAKNRAHGTIYDRAQCMRVFAEQGATLGDAITYAEAIFAQKAPLKLSTIHKFKGLENDIVYILDRELIGDDGQERNLAYVAATRAKKELNYIRLEDFEEVTQPKQVSAH